MANLWPGARGFDCNVVLDGMSAARMKEAGYDFAVRYVPRRAAASYDISISESRTIRQEGLALMLVQHVERPGWLPSVSLGIEYGKNAARAASVLGGYPSGCTLWCDLEEIFPGTPAAETIGYCNAWYDQVKALGFEPGLYVGFGCGLSAQQLYKNLKFRRYWSAYNLNRDQYPAVRGVQMRQLPYPRKDKRVPGIRFEYDENVVLEDFFGSTPTAWLSSRSHME